MDLKSLNFSLKTIFYVVFLLSSQAQGQICQTTTTSTTIQENNAVGDTVFSITMDAGVTLTLTQNPQEAFGLRGGDVIVNKVLDYEAGNNALVVRIQCSKPNPDGQVQIHILALIVSVENINDNLPVFAESQYTLNVSELSPVDTSVARIIATDLDGDRLYYRLDPDTEGFKLQTDTDPNILMQRLIDYDTVQRVTLTLYVQDTPIAPPVIPSHTVSTTIIVNIVDIDNRPPWFQPCIVMEIGTAKICLNSGYQGKVNLTEHEVAPLTLQPGPVYAMDGDKAINEGINYRLVGGNEAGIFQINENTGNITMLKAVDVAGPIILNVLASQVSNSDQFATTTVIFEVVSKSVHPPKFEKSSYEGYISIDSGLDSMVLESESSNRPLRVQAKDEDFSNGINPDVQYEVQDSSDFTITPQGFILMTKEISPGTISLQLRAVDTTNGETGTAALSVQVRPVCQTTTTNTTIQENNAVGAIVFSITMDAGVTLTLIQNPQEAFGLRGGDVIVNKVLDYEDGNNVLVVRIQCSKPNPDGQVQIHILTLIVSVENINDNLPVFAESQYTLPVSELSPVDTSVARIIATDLDGDRLYYRLDPDTEGFKLQTDTNPNILMQRLIDYDTVQRVTLTLYVQDTPITSAPPVIPSHTVSTTIIVNIIDIDNRPPWFQPCIVMEIGTAKICLNSGYQGKVNLTEHEVAPLTLQPGPVYAMDGDKGINEGINYRLVGGNEAGIFQINENTGNITMLKAVDVAGPIILNVLASQVSNSDQFATTTVIFEVVSKSVHPPKFEKSSYEGYISIDSGLDSLVLESESSNRPLRVQAKDEDFSNGINPDVQYEVQDSSDFTITPQGFILMTKEISPGTISLQLRAVDTTNGETGTAALSVQVRPDQPNHFPQLQDYTGGGLGGGVVGSILLINAGLNAAAQCWCHCSSFRDSHNHHGHGPHFQQHRHDQ